MKPIVLQGPAGSGKTHTALAIAQLWTSGPIYMPTPKEALSEFFRADIVVSHGEKPLVIVEEVVALQLVMDGIIKNLSAFPVAIIFTTQQKVKPSFDYTLINCNYHG